LLSQLYNFVPSKMVVIVDILPLFKTKSYPYKTLTRTKGKEDIVEMFNTFLKERNNMKMGMLIMGHVMK